MSIGSVTFQNLPRATGAVDRRGLVERNGDALEPGEVQIIAPPTPQTLSRTNPGTAQCARIRAEPVGRRQVQTSASTGGASH